MTTATAEATTDLSPTVAAAVVQDQQPIPQNDQPNPFFIGRANRAAIYLHPFVKHCSAIEFEVAGLATADSAYIRVTGRKVGGDEMTFHMLDLDVSDFRPGQGGYIVDQFQTAQNVIAAQFAATLPAE